MKDKKVSKLEKSLKPARTKAMWALNGISKIDYYHLGDDIAKMRRSGMSYMKISKALSEDCKDKLQGDSVSMLTVRRWCMDNLREEETQGESTINAYREYVKMLRVVEANIDMINIFLDAVTAMIRDGTDDKTVLSLFKSTKDLHVELEHYIARKQDLVSKIFILQKEIFNITTLNDLLRLVLNTVKEEDKEIYERILVKLRQNPKFVEAARKMDSTPSGNPIKK